MRDKALHPSWFATQKAYYDLVTHHTLPVCLPQLKNAPMATWTASEIQIYFHVFNATNGRSERSQFRLSVRSRDEEGTGIFVAISEMPFDEHVECLTMLKASMDKATGNKSNEATFS
uniref:Uncharacterized protein n=1 Tax=Candidatus Kentrum sp. DK TaxID=2126562 RepID=A0A450TR09_9GAMM|nr:MAG: hypothetical protein BECKDK2373B_GA0170837_12883 [Candidatus Kentron sp. DK]